MVSEHRLLYFATSTQFARGKSLRMLRVKLSSLPESTEKQSEICLQLLARHKHLQCLYVPLWSIGSVQGEWNNWDCPDQLPFSS